MDIVSSTCRNDNRDVFGVFITKQYTHTPFIQMIIKYLWEPGIIILYTETLDVSCLPVLSWIVSLQIHTLKFKPSVPQNATLFEDRVYKDVNNLKQVYWVGPNPIWLRLYKKRVGHRKAQREDHGRISKEDNHPQPRMGTSEDMEPPYTLIRDFQPLWLRKEMSIGQASQSVVICYGGKAKINTRSSWAGVGFYCSDRDTVNSAQLA